MARLLLWTAAGLVMVLALAWIVMQWAILPNLDRWRAPIEQQASRMLGRPMTLGSIRVLTTGLTPTVEVSDVVLLDAQRREALRFTRVLATLSPRSVFAWTPHFEQIRVDGARLDVRRDAQGRLHVAGIDMTADPAARTEGDASQWLLAQNEVVFGNAQVQWTDERRQAPTLALTAVDLVLRNAGRQHDVSLQATPPEGWGQRFSAQGRFTEPLWAWAQPGAGRSAEAGFKSWSGRLDVELPHADLATLRRHVTMPFELGAGRGAVKAGFDVSEGNWVGAAIDFALADVQLQLASHLQPLAFTSMHGHGQLKRSGQGDQRLTELTLARFAFATPDGQSWQPGDIALTLDGPPRQPTGGTLTAQRVDLAVLSALAARWPLSEAARARLQALQPRGNAERVAATWRGPMEAPERWEVRARVVDLSLEADDVALASNPNEQDIGRPGLRRATVDFVATHEGGEGNVSIDDGSMTFPGVLEKPRVDLQSLKADVRWTLKAGRTPGDMADLSVEARAVQWANADAQGAFSGVWRRGDGAGKPYPGNLDLSGKLTRGRIPSVARYLPLGLPADVRQYLSRALTAGRVTQAAFKVRGDLTAFPFRRQNGEFRVTAQVEDGQMNIAPDLVGAERQPRWPVFNNIAGEIAFDRTSMQIRNVSGDVEGVALINVQGEVADLMDRPVLAIGGVARGAADGMLRFVKRSPVGGWLSDTLIDTTVSGSTDLRLRLDVPLQALDKTTVQGDFELANSDVRIRHDVPLLARARGRVNFSEKRLRIESATASVYGGEASFEGGTQDDGSFQFKGQGTITAEGFAGATELGAVARLGRAMKGQAAYQMVLKFFGPHPEFTVNSNLQGMALLAPAPLGKAADVALPLQVSTQLLPSAGADKSTATRDVLRIRAGATPAAPWLDAHYTRDVGRGEPRVLGGGIGVGALAPTPPSGVHAIVKADTLDVNAWQALGVQLGFFDGAARAASVAAVAASGVKAAVAASAARAGGSTGATVPLPLAPPTDAGYTPDAVVVTAGQLTLENRRLTRVTAGLTQRGGDGTWRANVDADQLEGQVQWRPATPGQSPHLQARLSRLTLPESDAASVEALLTDDAPADPPSLDIVIDSFELKGRKLGRVDVEAVRERTAVDPRGWRLNRLRLTTPEAQFTGQGRWSAVDAASKARRMVLDFNLELVNSGALLERFGFADAIRGGKGAMTGQISWAGSPLTWHVPSLAGQVNLKLDAGQFLKVNAGAARLLGVLSLQSLPRRLMLDFRDVFSEGFAFDNITGDIVLSQGRAATNNLRMRGVQAVVLMEGSADILRETQNLDVWVVPEINVGAASLVYAVINPAVGLGTFLAQWFLSRPLMEATTRHFQIKGPWAEPQIERVQRQAGDRMPAYDTEPTPLTLPVDPTAAAPAPPTPSPGVPAAGPSATPRLPLSAEPPIAVTP